MQADIIKPGRLADATPRLFDKGRTALRPENVGLVGHARQARQYRERRGRQVQRLRPGLAIRQPGGSLLDVNPVPLQAEHFAEPSTREH
jgi:hypothetical protein